MSSWPQVIRIYSFIIVDDNKVKKEREKKGEKLYWILIL